MIVPYSNVDVMKKRKFKKRDLVTFLDFLFKHFEFFVPILINTI